MQKNLVIVESPAKAKTIEKFLGKDFKVLSSYGHIRDLKKKDFSIDVEKNFKPNYEIPADKKALVSTLKAEAKEAETVWLASDEDREGEAIAWHLYEVLKLKPENTKRIVFHEITKNAILKAIEQPRDININLVNAQQARRILDRIVGFELSPVLWRKVKPALSAGRVQSVAVRLIVEREREIHAFKTEAAYRVTAVFLVPDTDGKLVEMKAELARRIKTKKEAKRILKFIESNAAEDDFTKRLAAEVQKIKENKEWRDKLGFKYINDLLVGCSKMDEWRYQEAFLKDWEMGARENNSASQRWHIPVIDPKKIMIGDELNIGGKFLKEKINFALEFSDNIRVDHVMGLIEPYLMAKHADDSEFDTIHKNNDLEMYISQLQDENGKEYDFYWDYPKLLERIILPAFKEHGITKDLPMWEDICSYPDRFKMVYNQLELPRISFLDWEKAEDAVSNNPKGWFILGNHDTIPVMNYLQRKDGNGNEYTKNQSAWNPLYLAGYLHQNPNRAEERKPGC